MARTRNGTHGRTGFHRLVAGRTKGNGMGGRRKAHGVTRFKNRVHNRAGGR